MTNSESRRIRVRYAPSPTGFPHLGNIRTALFNWLFARRHDGEFILRIEDTDVARSVEGAVEQIIESLRWLGLDWDEGPYFQSHRLEVYKQVADRLLEAGFAYQCFCPVHRLEEMRRKQVEQKRPPGYDRLCRVLTQEERDKCQAQGIRPVVRFKTPLEGKTAFNDLIRGEVVFDNSTLDDFVLLKSDGYPTYHLANIADDHFMEISHVLRADEWLSSTPKHMLLYQALGWQPPLFAHLPMILGPDRSKLSKRHGATALLEYSDKGYLPEAMLNFLALLGWSLDDKTELMSREEIVKNFSIERISKTAAIFNREKLDWMNGVYLRRLSPEEFSRQALPFLEKELPADVKRPLDFDYVKQVMPLIQERARTLAEVPQLSMFFFVPEEYEGELAKDIDPEIAKKALGLACDKLAALKSYDAASIEGVLRPMADELGLKTGKLFRLFRVTTTGREAATPLFQTLEILGKGKCLDLITTALSKLEATNIKEQASDNRQ